MPEKNEKQAPQLTPEVIELIKAVMAETRKPTELEQLQIAELHEKQEAKKLAVEQAQQQRQQNAAAVKEQLESKKRQQKVCIHKGGKDSHSTTVFIDDQFGGYILCQKCQVAIRREESRKFYPKEYSGLIVFDSGKFEALFQTTNESGIFA